MANIYTQNPIRIDTAMTASFLTMLNAALTLTATARPLRITKVNIETASAPAAATTVTIVDASNASQNSTNVIFEKTVPASANQNIDTDWNDPRVWRNFQVTTIPTNTVVWIHHR